jgi:hypothetical protein
MSDTTKKEPTSKHALAQSRAKSKLVERYREEYVTLYREECAKLGLRNHATKAERLARIREQLRKLEESAGV